MKLVDGVFRGVKIYMVDKRIDMEDRKNHLFFYDIRHCDEKWLPYMIQPNVWVNHFGTIVTKQPLNHIMSEDKEIELTKKEMKYFTDNIFREGTVDLISL
jgi:hypothetical protein